MTGCIPRKLAFEGRLLRLRSASPRSAPWPAAWAGRMLQCPRNRTQNDLPRRPPTQTTLKAYYSDIFQFPLPPGPRFPMQKYAGLRQRLVPSGVLTVKDLLVPPPASDVDLLRVHTPAYLERVKAGTLSDREIRRLGFPWSAELVERSRRSVGGTIAPCPPPLTHRLPPHLS